jgi:exodeoxyribonuclease-1
MADPAHLAQESWPFDDERLPELLFRYRARNFPDTLNPEEQGRWRLFCQQRLSSPQWGAPNTLESFDEAMGEWLALSTPLQREVLIEWQGYSQQLRKRLSL